MQFVDIKNDIAFRKIFGNENKKIILISFLNAVMKLKGKDAIEDVEILNPYQLPIIKNLKASIIDVKARDKKGKTYIIEMQVAEPDGLDKRLLYYASKEYSQQIESGEHYTELKPVIFIGIFDFKFTSGEKYLSHHEAYDYAAMREQDDRGKLVLAEKRANKRGRLEVAKNLKEMGFAPSDIKKATNLSDEEIERL